MSPAARARMVLALDDPDQAQVLADALSPDSEGFLDLAVEGSALVVEAGSGSVMGLLRSLDDALAAVEAAEGVSDVGDG